MYKYVISLINCCIFSQVKYSRVLETGEFFLLSLMLRRYKLLRKCLSFITHCYELEILSASEKVKTLEMLAPCFYQDFFDRIPVFLRVHSIFKGLCFLQRDGAATRGLKVEMQSICSA